MASAHYTSPSETFTFSVDLPPPLQNPGVHQKTAYLSALRSHVSTLQGEVNTFLTQKMEQDKAAEEAGKGGTGKAADEREEEMYGEEDPDQDS